MQPVVDPYFPPSYLELRKARDDQAKYFDDMEKATDAEIESLRRGREGASSVSPGYSMSRYDDRAAEMLGLASMLGDERNAALYGAYGDELLGDLYSRATQSGMSEEAKNLADILAENSRQASDSVFSNARAMGLNEVAANRLKRNSSDRYAREAEKEVEALEAYNKRLSRQMALEGMGNRYAANVSGGLGEMERRNALQRGYEGIGRNMAFERIGQGEVSRRNAEEAERRRQAARDQLAGAGISAAGSIAGSLVNSYSKNKGS